MELDGTTKLDLISPSALRKDYLNNLSRSMVVYFIYEDNESETWVRAGIGALEGSHNNF